MSALPKSTLVIILETLVWIFLVTMFMLMPPLAVWILWGQAVSIFPALVSGGWIVGNISFLQSISLCYVLGFLFTGIGTIKQSKKE